MTITSPILRTVARFAVPLTLAMSLVIFYQGHNLPGGGFIAGVLGAVAGAMYLMAFGVEKAARFKWWKMSVVGLLIAVAKGTASLLTGDGFMNHTAYHLPLWLPEIAAASAAEFSVGALSAHTLTSSRDSSTTSQCDSLSVPTKAPSELEGSRAHDDYSFSLEGPQAGSRLGSNSGDATERVGDARTMA